jgi:hypothetical protein
MAPISSQGLVGIIITAEVLFFLIVIILCSYIFIYHMARRRLCSWQIKTQASPSDDRSIPQAHEMAQRRPTETLFAAGQELERRQQTRIPSAANMEGFATDTPPRVPRKEPSLFAPKPLRPVRLQA